jgi:hypothetical protein
MYITDDPEMGTRIRFLCSFARKHKFYSYNDKNIALLITFIFYHISYEIRYDTFVESLKHCFFLVQPLQKPPLCNSTKTASN